MAALSGDLNSDTLLPVAPESLDDFYEDIVPGLKKVLAKGQGLEWTVYSVYHELKLGLSELWVALDEYGEYEGFVVLSAGEESTNGATYLFVWIAYSEKHGAIGRHLGQLERMAKASGHSKMRFGTTRRGWEKIATEAGFEIEEIRYVKELNYE